ncbi:hypothetical protein [Ammoniphilus oxalaticus]|nr:hypothetical protein [Ammoniphilus oxalaticus]
MSQERIATVYMRNEDALEQQFQDYEELLVFILDHETEIDYINWG